MAEPTKHIPINGGTLISDLKRIFSLRTKRRVAFAYGFMFAFVIFTIFLTLNPPSSTSTSPWFSNIFSRSSFNSTTSSSFFSKSSNRSQYPSIFSYFFPNSTSLSFPSNNSTSPNTTLGKEAVKNQTQITNLHDKIEVSPSLHDKIGLNPNQTKEVVKNQTQSTDLHDKIEGGKPNLTSHLPNYNGTISTDLPDKIEGLKQNATGSVDKQKNTSGSVDKKVPEKVVRSNSASSQVKKQRNDTGSQGTRVSVKHGSEDDLVKGLMNCDLFDGDWVRDDSYPLYKPGSCPLIDEQFNCFLNGRPDQLYQQFKWKPNGCTLPRLDGGHMLELLRGKRLVFVGDSLNRNMWESLICILRNSVKDQSKVYEASGRHHFRSEPSYSFVFQDYNCTVEFFVSPFLVHEWEIPEKDGKKKETLRLDLIAGSAENYKDADFIIFNTGHWWTHDKTSKGKDYYQEGSHVYGELNVLEAFRKALTTWARWVDKKVDPKKSLVFFRGYSASHFSGGQWNSGGQCDHETEPIKNQTYLSEYPPKMRVLEKVLHSMKTPVSYLNITRLTDYRKDGHPSMYRKLHLSPAERKSPLLFQDCSHWCLPGVPDAWNEILYAELLMKTRK